MSDRTTTMMMGTTPSAGCELSRANAVDAAMRTGLAGGAQEMVSAYGTSAAEGRIDLRPFLGQAVAVDWPSVTVTETGSF